MPRYRKLHVKALESLDINDMPDDFIRLFWILLPLALDRLGCGIDSTAWLKSKVFPLREDVTQAQVGAAFDWFCSRGMAERYEVDGRSYFWLPKFLTYQGDTSKEAESQYPPPPGLVNTNSGPTLELVASKSASDAAADADAEAKADADATATANAPTKSQNLPAAAAPSDDACFADAVEALAAYGIEDGKAREVTSNRGSGWVLAWCAEIARRGNLVKSPAGLIIKMAADGIGLPTNNSPPPVDDLQAWKASVLNGPYAGMMEH